MGAEQINNHHGLPNETPEGALVVQSVRHHCDVIASMWYKIGQRIPMQDLIHSILQGNDRYLRRSGFYNRYPCNYVLRFETLQHEFDVLCMTAGLPQTLLKNDPSPRPDNSPWQEVINSAQAHEIYSHYQEEMDHYGYGPEGNLPKSSQDGLNKAIRKDKQRYGSL